MGTLTHRWPQALPGGDAISVHTFFLFAVPLRMPASRRCVLETGEIEILVPWRCISAAIYQSATQRAVCAYVDEDALFGLR